MKTLWILGTLAALLLAACQPLGATSVVETATLAATNALVKSATPVNTPTLETPVRGTMLEPQGFIQRVHDPVMVHEGNQYYVYSTGGLIPFICSKDKVTWEFCGRVFQDNPAWTMKINPGLVDIWAPDISFYNNQWHLYYAVSSMGSQNSAIGLATNETLDPKSPKYAWVDQGMVMQSQPGDAWNAIDPNLVLDEKGEPWLAWGSYWQGIYLRKINAATGKPAADDKSTYHLADRSAGSDHNPAIEGSFIANRHGKWYLFASFDQCCQGVSSTYNVRVGRSDKLTGPYADRDGIPMLKGGGTRILSEYGQWKGPGHNGMLIEDGVYWMVYHAYDANQIGIPKMRIESLSWDAEGWPSLPSQTQKP
jgi:arabinan endo-1,5-alpha-L-arabinosidase